jgi:2-keto-4-pentenoate hydratase/2-oxohepta-3-ene-1,7-dioic acid hydratase in catechol pathway
MRIARWRGPDDDGREPIEGIVHDERMLAFPAGVTVQRLLESGLRDALELGTGMIARTTGEEPSLDSVHLLPPLRPAAIRDFVAFEEHVEGMTAGVGGVPPEWYEYPTFYFSNPHSVVAPDGVVTPPATASLDFELELAAVIGAAPRNGANLSAEEGEAAIFGYTIMNDWSARDLQNREMQVRLGPAKGKDFGTSLGPWIVTADEFDGIRDPHGFLPLRVSARINGEVIGEDLMSNMGWPFGELVAYASRNAHVVPGDVLGSGTAGNGGCLGELWGRSGTRTPPPLVAGDVVELAIEGIGELRGTVGARVDVPHIPPARARDRRRIREGVS